MGKAPVPRRAPGRPRAGADAASRERLLDVAIALFADHGIANTTVAQIARAGHVTSAMVHYWFETREKMLDALVEERLAPMIRSVWDAIGDEAGDPMAVVAAIVERMLQATAKLPWLPSLWLREIVQEGGQLRERLLSHIPRERALLFRRSIARAQERGEINGEVSPDLVFISILALVMLPQATAKIWRRLNPDMAVDRAQLERHVLALITHGLAGHRSGARARSPRRSK
jgi:AcrR family transcriptional regulator